MGPLTTDCTMPVALLVMVMVEPGTTAPLPSITVPRMPVSIDCASSGAPNNTMAAQNTSVWRIRSLLERVWREYTQEPAARL